MLLSLLSYIKTRRGSLLESCVWILLFGCTLFVAAADSQEQRGVRAANSVGGFEVYREHNDYALLFGTNKYDDPSWPALTNPIPDAEAIAKELKQSFGFETEVVKDPTRNAIFSKLKEYSTKHYGEGDQLFIFFAGHGVYDDVFGQGFIVARDSHVEDTSRGSYASYDDLKAVIDRMRVKHILLVLDACYSGTIDYRVAEGGSRGIQIYGDMPIDELFNKKAPLQTRKFLTSGRKDTVSDGLPGKSSPFAANLLKALRNYEGERTYISFNGLLAAVEPTRPEPHWGDWGSSDPGSDFFFARRLANAVPPTAPRRSSRPSVAVLGFQRLGQAADASVSAILSEYLTSELESGDSVRVVAGEDVARVISDLTLPNASGYGRESLARIYKALGCEFVVSGSYSVTQPEGAVRVDLRLQNVRNGEMVSGFNETGTNSRLGELATRLGNRIRNTMGISAPEASENGSARMALPKGTAAARYYADGLLELRSFDLLSARDQLQLAVKADPDSALAHLALAKAYYQLGYDAEAIRESSKAHDLAGRLSLPLQERMRIDGYYCRIAGRWEQAIESYRDLWKYYHDVPEYALELASVETDAGKAQEALATLDELRKVPMESGDDPRIDLQEAEAARQAQDYKRQQQAATTALKKATAQTAKLFTAEAYWESCTALASLGDLKGAETACEQASASAERGAGQMIKANSLTMLANLMNMQGKVSEEMEIREEIVRITRQIQCRKNLSAALMNLAVLQFSQNQLQEADRSFEEATSIAEDIDDKDQLLKLKVNKGDRLYAEGDYSAASENYQRAISIATQIANKKEIANVTQRMAEIAYQLGNLSEAERDLQYAINLAGELGSQDVKADALSVQGDVLLARGQIDAARQAYQDAREMYAKQNDKGSVTACLASLAALDIEDGKAFEAEAMARQAADEFHQERTVDAEASAREVLSRALLVLGKVVEAGVEIDAAINLAPEDRSVRMSLAVTSALYQAQIGKAEAANEALDASLVQANRMKLVGSQLEIRLAQAEIKKHSDPGGARAILASLEQDAKLSGFLLIAGKAHQRLDREFVENGARR